jgi:alkanesulfonate monooxygenase SsuD/methylene tetrahydromethanopterin reductase-like flavin-dependent oxidoreductase (luciferase family)
MPVPPVGVFLPTLGAADDPVADVAGAAANAESLGFESVWVVDQLVAGTGNAILESTLVLAASAAVTERVLLGLGVLIAPLRETAWIAKQVATLQHLSRDRLVLGVGVGGDRHERSWAAARVPRAERGARLDAALRALPDLIAGKEVDGVRLAPGATVPPIIVGGMSDIAVARADRHDGWFLFPAPPEGVRAAVDRVSVPITANLTVALTGDPALPPHEEILDAMADPDGLYGMPRDVAGQALAYGSVEDVAALLDAYGTAGAARVVVTFAAGDWGRQAELLARAARS